MTLLDPVDASLATPLQADRVELDHGMGGGMSRELIEGLIAPRLGSVHQGKMEDSAVLALGTGRIALTTDSFVVDPIFFVGGDIGKVAVCGTVNDLAVSGATPRFLTLALVLETGFPMSALERILDSIREAAEEAGVTIVAGDTKVVRKGEVDKIFINTAGVGEFEHDLQLGSAQVAPGDAVIVTGQLGNHSMHILSLREGLGFEERISSDCAPLNGLIERVLDRHAAHVHCMRDITRGGLGTVLNEIAEAADVSIMVEEAALPILHETAMASDMLGVNPLYLANEGNLCLFVDRSAAAAVLESVRSHPYGECAAIVGAVKETGHVPVASRDRDGIEAPIPLLYGAELPRLC